MTNKYTITSQKELSIIVQEIAKYLSGGEVILLSGSLGAGKTMFVKELARILKSTDVVTSPTFVLRNEYNILEKKLVHIDLYRLDTVSVSTLEFLEDVGEKDFITCIEWPERLKDVEKLLGKKISISIKILPNDIRELTVRF